jgi:hypothetical protein
MTIAMFGVDLGKSSVNVVGLDDRGAVVLRRRVTRDRLMTLLTKLPSSVELALGLEPNEPHRRPCCCLRVPIAVLLGFDVPRPADRAPGAAPA